MAFHPQIVGLSKRKNPWVEQFLRLIMSTQQDDWRRRLPIATVVHNNHVNTTIKVAPAEALLGYLPTFDPLAPPTMRNV